MKPIALFPLPSVVLQPQGLLPVHFFEPDKVALLKDSLASGREIGFALMYDPEAAHYHPDDDPDDSDDDECNDALGVRASAFDAATDRGTSSGGDAGGAGDRGDSNTERESLPRSALESDTIELPAMPKKVASDGEKVGEKTGEDDALKQRVYRTGCIGGIIRFDDQGDDYYVAHLRGKQRFRIEGFLETDLPYITALVSDDAYQIDQLPQIDWVVDGALVDRVVNCFASFCQLVDIELAFHDNFHENPLLIIALACMICPFSDLDKYCVLTTLSVRDRLLMLEAMLEMLVMRHTASDIPLQ
ncbi:MAG: LON peptidase substrate-binding domain-containing protein [Alphaproteobacteria bacterium]|nr:LON peptidase substrate-binding domain-containing protein [Alphaproteobacteria bacterium]